MAVSLRTTKVGKKRNSGGRTTCTAWRWSSTSRVLRGRDEKQWKPCVRSFFRARKTNWSGRWCGGRELRGHCMRRRCRGQGSCCPPRSWFTDSSRSGTTQCHAFNVQVVVSTLWTGKRRTGTTRSVRTQTRRPLLKSCSTTVSWEEWTMKRPLRCKWPETEKPRCCSHMSCRKALQQTCRGVRREGSFQEERKRPEETQFGHEMEWRTFLGLPLAHFRSDRRNQGWHSQSGNDQKSRGASTLGCNRPRFDSWSTLEVGPRSRRRGGQVVGAALDLWR